MDWSMFFEVHKDLPREGPGTSEDVTWACDLAQLPRDARVCDVGAGVGADIEALCQSVPDGQVIAVDKHVGFVAQMTNRFAGLPRVSVVEDDMNNLPQRQDAPYDMIWCAGALYFLGLANGLQTMRRALKPGGVLAFSEPCCFGPPDAETEAFWEGYPARQAEDILTEIRAAGYDVLGHRAVSDAGWEAYYQPMEARIARLRPGASPALTEMLDMCADEAVQWRRMRNRVGYVLSVARLR